MKKNNKYYNSINGIITSSTFYKEETYLLFTEIYKLAMETEVKRCASPLCSVKVITC